jgi:hypothetical protein
LSTVTGGGKKKDRKKTDTGMAGTTNRTCLKP